MGWKLPAGLGLAGRFPLGPQWGASGEDVYSEDSDGTRSSIRRLLDFGAADEPTSLWESLLKSGYREVYALQVEGIPYLFGERELYTIRGLAAGNPDADTYTMSYALAVREGDHHDQACNREDGLAVGRALDFCLGRQQIADEGLGPLLFARPTLRATLTSAVTDPAADTFSVDTTTSWDGTGLLYIGRECVRYLSTTSTEFGSCLRGVAGYPHYHTASTSGAYAQCTDTPVFWRGRLVTLWAHLVSPEGRFLGERWATLGAYCRHEWRGFVRDTPRPEQAGMVLTCLPLPRLAAQEFGAEVQGKMIPDWIVSEPADTITMARSASGTAPTSPVTTNQGIISLQVWAAIVANHLTTALSTDIVTVTVRPSGNEIDVKATSVAGSGQWLIQTNAWFLERDEYLTTAEVGLVPGRSIIPLIWSSYGTGTDQAGVWVVVRLEPSADLTDAELGDTGMLALEVDGETEIAFYDRRLTSSDGDKIAFRLSGRGLMSTPRLNLWGGETTVRAIAGALGGWMQCLRILMTSSGTGNAITPGARGRFDWLPYGFGLGLPEDWIVVDPTIGQEMAGAFPIVAASTSRTSIKELLCGWLALTRHCLVQRRQADGSIRLEVISTDVVDDADATTLAAADVLMDGHDTPEMMEPPNHVRISSGDLLRDGATHIVRDAPRAQAEGVRSVEIKAPGVTAEQALRYGAEMILLGDGQAAVRCRLPPWFAGQIGDTRDLTGAHPAVWDWAAGAFAPSSVIGVAVEHGRSLFDQTQEVTFLLAGHAQERVYLCPCALVTQAVSATVYRVEAGGATGFAVGDEVMFYERSNEDADTGTVTISAITEGIDYDTITVDADPSVDGNEIVITFDVYANAVTRQRRFMFAQADRWWR